jgi:predicted NAD/FAD-binding protein
MSGRSVAVIGSGVADSDDDLETVGAFVARHCFSADFVENFRTPLVAADDVSRLMRLPGPFRFLATLRGRDRVDPAAVLAEMTYHHPLHTPESVAAQRLPTLNFDRIAYAGAASGMRAAQHLGADWPATQCALEAVTA